MNTETISHTFIPIVMLAVVAAHFVDLTFNFTSVLTGWAFWLAVGVLLTQEPAPDAQSIRLEDASRLKTAVSGRFSVLTNASGRWLSAKDRILRLIQFILFFCALLLWRFDTGADILLQQGVGANSFLTPTVGDYVVLQAAASDRPWDDRLWNAAANSAIQFFMVISGYPEVAKIAQDDLNNALTLNRYDAPSAYLSAVLATWQADHAASVDDVEKWLNEAEAYHAAAARLMPGEPYIWREWGRFMLTYRGDETATRQYLERALALDPGDAAALELMDSLAPLP